MVWQSHLQRVGTRLNDSVGAFNQAVGSLDTRVLPSARRLRELGLKHSEEIIAPGQIGVITRQIGVSATAEELDAASQSGKGGTSQANGSTPI